MIRVGRKEHACVLTEGHKQDYCLAFGGQCNGRQISVESFAEINTLTSATLFYLAAIHCPSIDRETEQRRATEIYEINYHQFVRYCCILRSRTADLRIFYAGSSRIFEAAPKLNIDESHIAAPSTHYGYAKTMAREFLRDFTQISGVSSFYGILFNHDSEHRSAGFLISRLISSAIEAKKGKGQTLAIRDLRGAYDASLAVDFCHYMIRLVESDADSGDYVFSSGLELNLVDLVAEISAQMEIQTSDWLSIHQPPPYDDCSSLMTGDATKLSRVVALNDLPIDRYVSVLLKAFAQAREV